jgi:SAM-dependent methyltransferase
MKADLNRYEDPWTAEVYDFQSGTKEDDLAFWLRLAGESEGPVLELACGTGRVAIPLARAGHRVTGLDVSPNMLAVARAKLAREPAEVHSRLRLAQGDMTSFDLGERFGLIFIAYHSFQALTSRAQQRRCLECCTRHLRSRGRLAINVFNPRLSTLVAGVRDGGPDDYLGPDGVMVRETWRTEFDTANQRLFWRPAYECTAPDGQVTTRRHMAELRYFFRFEMEWMLEACSFELEALYGNFDRSPFAAESPEMIFIARRAR